MLNKYWLTAFKYENRNTYCNYFLLIYIKNILEIIGTDVVRYDIYGADNICQDI